MIEITSGNRPTGKIKDTCAMKYFSFVVITAAFAALVLTTGCGKSLQERIDKMKENAQDEQQGNSKSEGSSNQDYTDEWSAFRTESETQINDNAQSIEDLRPKLAAADDKARAELGKQLEALTKTNRELKSKLDDYQDQGKMNWDAFKRDFSRELYDLNTDLNKLKSAVGN
jgi:predicted RNase H-like nuclease (RuvC/YqgF family)